MTDEPQPGWISLCCTGDVLEGAPKRVEPPGLPPLAVFNLGGSFYVTDDTCTHGEASLCDGYVDGDEIECPWHAGKFCIKDGRATAFPAVEPLKTYPAIVANGCVWLLPTEQRKGLDV